MSSSQDFVDFVMEQIRVPHPVSCRKMFGEYAIYCGTKTVALVCDDTVFIKPTDEGRAFMGAGLDCAGPVGAAEGAAAETVAEGPPYPGAKPWLMVGERFEDAEWFSELVRITFDALPEPKAKAKVKAKSSGKGKMTK